MIIKVEKKNKILFIKFLIKIFVVMFLNLMLIYYVFMVLRR